MELPNIETPDSTSENSRERCDSVSLDLSNIINTNKVNLYRKKYSRMFNFCMIILILTMSLISISVFTLSSIIQNIPFNSMISNITSITDKFDMIQNFSDEFSKFNSILEKYDNSVSIEEIGYFIKSVNNSLLRLQSCLTYTSQFSDQIPDQIVDKQMIEQSSLQPEAQPQSQSQSLSPPQYDLY